MYYYQDAYNELEEDFKEKVELLKKHKTLFPIANEYAEKYSSNHEPDFGRRVSSVSFAADTGTIQSLGLHLTLGEDDVVEDALKVVDKMMKDKRLELIKSLDKTLKDKYVPIEAEFTDGSLGKLVVRIHIYQSIKCEEVGTGKWEEIKKVVCK